MTGFNTEARVWVTLAAEGDAHALAFLHEELFPNCWSAETFREYCLSPHYLVLKAETEGHLVGVLVCQAILDEGEILTLGVLAGHRRRGVGARLLRAAIDEVRAAGVRVVFLDVAETNHAAISLYQSSGFRTIARREGYYRAFQSKPLAALIMQLDA